MALACGHAAGCGGRNSSLRCTAENCRWWGTLPRGAQRHWRDAPPPHHAHDSSACWREAAVVTCLQRGGSCAAPVDQQCSCPACSGAPSVTLVPRLQRACSCRRHSSFVVELGCLFRACGWICAASNRWDGSGTHLASPCSAWHAHAACIWQHGQACTSCAMDSLWTPFRQLSNAQHDCFWYWVLSTCAQRTMNGVKQH